MEDEKNEKEIEGEIGNSSNSNKNAQKINLKKLKAKLKTKERWHKFVFFISTFLYIIVIYMQSNIPIYNQAVASVKRFIFGEDITRNFQYIKSYFINMYINELLDKLVGNFEIHNRFTVLSNFRMTQRVINLVENKNPFFQNSTKNVRWAADSIDPYSDFDPEIENTTDLLDYETNKTKLSYTKERSFMGKGGFVFSVNLTYFLNNKTILDPNKYPSLSTNANLTLVQKIKNESKALLKFFPTDETATITLDFLLANYDLEYICAVILHVTLTDTGQAYMEFEMMFLDRNIYSGVDKLIRLGIEILFVIFFLIYVIILFMKIYIQTIIEYITIKSEIDKKNHSKLNYKKLGINNEIIVDEKSNLDENENKFIVDDKSNLDEKEIKDNNIADASNSKTQRSNLQLVQSIFAIKKATEIEKEKKKGKQL